AAWVRLNSTSSYLAACFFALTLIAPVQPWSADGALNAILILPPAAPAAGGTVAGVGSAFLVSSVFDGSCALRQAVGKTASARTSPLTMARLGWIICLSPCVVDAGRANPSLMFRMCIRSASALGAGRRQRRG